MEDDDVEIVGEWPLTSQMSDGGSSTGQAQDMDAASSASSSSVSQRLDELEARMDRLSGSSEDVND